LENDEWGGEMSQSTRDGQKVLVDARLTLVRDRQGHPKSVLCINSDVTEREKFQTQFLRSQRMESIGTLAGGMAHDLNNVLTPIVMAAQLLDGGDADEDRRRLIEMIQSSARRGADLVRQVLAFCRGIGGRRMELQVDSLLNELHHILRETLPKSVHLEFSVAKQLWPVVADPTQIHQVLLNLCVNARDAMPNGGTLRLSAENAMFAHHTGSPGEEPKPAPHIVLSVADTGTGIPDAIREKIFDPFFTTKAQGKGTGLGLSTSMGIVKSHGGVINLYTEQGRGSTFKVYLPSGTAAAKGQLQDAETCLPRGNGELILVVDDEVSIRTIAAQTLETYGYRVLTAKDGAESLKVYAKQGQDIAVVITDMMMPVMDGPATIHALSRMNPNVRVIAASGLSPEAHLANATHPVVKAFLPKPYPTKTLLSTLQDVLALPAKPRKEL
jgi:signal transduction histidine kinase/CheY-like chemotaxis protein